MVTIDPMTVALQTHASKRVPYRAHITLGAMGDILDTIESGAQTAAQNVVQWGVNQIPSAGSTSGTSLSTLDVVPYQDAVFQNVIKPIADQVNASGHALSYQTLNAMLSAIIDIENRWLQFLHNTPWPTARQKDRAAGAESTLAPYFTLYIQRITDLMQSASSSITQILGGTPAIGTTPVTLPGFPGATGTGVGPVAGGGTITAGFSTPIAVGIGVVLLYLFKKGKL